MKYDIEIPRLYDTALPLEELRTPAEVKKAAEKEAEAGSILWLCYLQEDKQEMLARVFAAKKTKKQGLQLLEVMREKPGHNVFLRRRIYWTGMGWQVIFVEPGETGWQYWNGYTTDTRPGTYIKILNPEFVTQFDQFKFCGWKPGSVLPLIDYLNLWLEKPGVEYFAKLNLRPKKSLVKKAETSASFRYWLRTRTPEQIKDANIYGPAATLESFRSGKEIPAAALELENKRKLASFVSEYARPIMKKHSHEKIKAYIDQMKEMRQRFEYRDYLQACEFLRLNFSDTKIAFPHLSDLHRLHDQRIEEKARAEIEKDKEARAELYATFEKVAQELKRFEITAGGFCVIIPESPQDLIREGAFLHHCVGRMNYDQRMAEGRSFIAFLRSSKDPKTPLVTLEYDLQKHRLAQVYGDHDSAPEPKAREFAEDWARIVTEQLKAEEKAKENAKKKKEAAA